MIVDLDKLQNLLKKPEILDGAGVLRREGNMVDLCRSGRHWKRSLTAIASHLPSFLS
jgi:hypothetical protein